MGDRCDCTLLLKEAASQDLLKLLDEHLWAPEVLDERCFVFEEVNYAHLPDPIQSYLQENDIQAAWTNTAGGEYGDGVIIFPSGRDWLLNNGEIVIRLSEITGVSMDLAGKDQAFLDEVRA